MHCLTMWDNSDASHGLNMFQSGVTQILHSLKPCWCLHSVQNNLHLFLGSCSNPWALWFLHWLVWLVITANGMLQTVMSMPRHAMNTSCYRDALSLQQRRLTSCTKRRSLRVYPFISRSCLSLNLFLRPQLWHWFCYCSSYAKDINTDLLRALFNKRAKA